MASQVITCDCSGCQRISRAQFAAAAAAFAFLALGVMVDQAPYSDAWWFKENRAARGLPPHGCKK